MTNISNPGINSAFQYRNKYSANWLRSRGKSHYLAPASQDYPNHRIRQLPSNLKKNALKEEEHLRSEKHFKNILEELHDVVLIHDENGTCISCIAKDEADLVLPARECIGQNVTHLVPQPVAQRILQNIQTCLQTGRIQTMDYFLNVKGEIRYYEGRMMPSGMQNVVTAIRNITDRRRAEEALRHSEENNRALVDTISYGINEIDLHGTITQANKAFHRMHGYADGELIGTSLLDLFATDALRKNYKRVSRRILRERPERGHILTRNKTRNGKIITLKVDWNYKLDDDGNIVGYISVITDITEQAKAEKELRRSEIRFRDMLRTLHDIVIIYDKDGTCLDCFFKDEADLTVPSNKVVGLNVDETLPAGIARSILSNIRKTLASGEIHTLEYELTINQKQKFFEGRMIPYGSHNVAAAIRNITSRKRAEEALRRSEENYRVLVDTISYGINEIDLNGIITQSNSAFHRMHGYDDGELIGTSMLDLIASEYLKKNYHRFLRRILSERPDPSFVYSRNLTRDGRIILIKVEWNYKCDRDGNVIGIISIVTDVTEQKKAEKALIESEKKHRAIFQSFPDLIFIFDGKGNYLDYHASNPADLVAPSEELIGKNLVDVLPLSTAEVAIDSIKKTLQSGEIQNFEFNLPLREATQYYEGRMLAYEPNKILSFVRNITDRITRELALQQSEERLERALDASELGMWNYQRATNSLMVDERWAGMLGYEVEEVEPTFKGWSDLIHPEDFRFVKQAWLDHRKGLSPVCEYEVRMHTKSGDWNWIQCRGKVIQRDVRSKILRFAGTHKDIDEKKRSEELLATYQERFEHALDASELGMWDYYDDEDRLVLDDRWATILGYRIDEIEPHLSGWNNLLHPDDIVKEEKAWEDHKEGRSDVFELEMRMRTKSGDWKWLQSSGKIIKRDKSGESLRSIGTIKDISERKRAEELLASSQERLERALDASELGMWNYDRGTDRLVVDERWAGMLGFDVKEIVPNFKGWYDMVHPEDFHVIKRTWVAQQKGLIKVCEFEVRMHTKSGDWKWIQGRGKPILWDEESKVLGLSGTIKDIDERKRSENLLAVYQERLERALDASGLGLWDYHDLEDRMVVDERWAEMLGYGVEEIRPNISGWTEIVHPEDTCREEEARRAHVQGESEVMDIELRMRTKSGDWKWMQSLGKIVERDKLGNPLRSTGTIKDITERKRAENLLEMSQERLERALDASDLGMWNYDELADNLVVDERWANMLGFKKEEISNKNKDFYKLVHPDDTTIVTEAWRAHEKKLTPVCEFEARMRTKSGDWKWIQVRGKVVQWDKNGIPLRTTGTHKDITQQKRDQEERERLEAHLRQSQKMEVVGTLAGGIAHDFNNILQPIIGYLHMVMEDIPLDSPLVGYLIQVEKCAQRAKDLVKQILVFSREDQQRKDAVDVCQILRETLTLVRSTLPPNIEVHIEIEEDSGHIWGDPTQVGQVIINLLTNAYLAIGSDWGTVDIRLSKLRFDSKQEDISSDLSAGSYLKLTISDTGIGMENAILERIFEPFFTTRDVGQGTGLGLSVVQGVVKSHGGAITVNSVPNKGSTFDIYWPSQDLEPLGKSDLTLSADPPPRGNERILLVDDNAAVAHSVKSSLERLDYKVTVRTSSLRALELFKKNPEKFDLVVTDQSMPQMTGAHLAKELIEVRTDLPVILITGLGQILTEQEIQFLGVKACLGKPFDAADLSRVVRKLLL